MTPQKVELFKLGLLAAILNCEWLLCVKIWGYMCLKKILAAGKDLADFIKNNTELNKIKWITFIFQLWN